MAGEPQNGVRFGIELEFIVLSPLPNDTRITKSEDHAAARKSVALQLGKLTNLPFACQCRHRWVDARCPVCREAPKELLLPQGCVIWPPQAIHDRSTAPEYQYYFVKYEYLGSPSGSGDDPTRKGMEISTPIYNEQELVAGLPGLSKIIQSLPYIDQKVMCDPCCGLHVHVGLKQGITVLFVKKVVTLVMLLEKCLIQTLLPIIRAENKWAWLVCEQSSIAQRSMMHWRDDSPAEVGLEFAIHFPVLVDQLQPGPWNNGEPDKFFQTLFVFWEMKDLETMGNGLLKNCLTKLGLYLSLRAHHGSSISEGSHSTVEFRYPQMNYDMAFIKNWTEIFCRLAAIANFETAAYRGKLSAIMAALNQVGVSRTPSWELLLTAIDLQHQIPQWKKQVGRHDNGVTISNVDEDGILQPDGE